MHSVLVTHFHLPFYIFSPIILRWCRLPNDNWILPNCRLVIELQFGNIEYYLSPEFPLILFITKNDISVTPYKIKNGWLLLNTRQYQSSNSGPALEIQIVGEFPLKSKIERPQLKYLVRIRRLRRPFSPWRLCEFHALYPPSTGPVQIVIAWIFNSIFNTFLYSRLYLY